MLRQRVDSDFAISHHQEQSVKIAQIFQLVDAGTPSRQNTNTMIHKGKWSGKSNNDVVNVYENSNYH